MITRPMRELVRVEFHQSGSTRVAYERIPGFGVDIPTSAIPHHLRQLGSRFFIVWQGITPEPQDTVAELRTASWLRVEELDQPES